MVTGLEVFRDRFEAFADCYVLIGGAASDLVMGEAGLPFRATRDLDIVLCVEALNDRFMQAFWAFIREGGYAHREKSEGPRRYYRFQRPEKTAFPAMLDREAQRCPVLALLRFANERPFGLAERAFACLRSAPGRGYSCASPSAS